MSINASHLLRNLSAQSHRSLSSSSEFVLSDASTVDDAETVSRGRIVCITSGKGGVGKTTSAASFAFGLEGAMALTIGRGATATQCFVQGWFKFGGVEFLKVKAVERMGEEAAWNNETPIYLGADAAAETIADIFLCLLDIRID